MGSDSDKIAKFGRKRCAYIHTIGVKEEIRIHSIRAGDVVGDHIVLYAGLEKRIELKHEAHNRECFAKSLILAVIFMVDQNKI
ncbi:MAG: dihydrodipicolinate reductase C-terminal domain-containing protein [Candidatus Thorarchaeota archaeon]